MERRQLRSKRQARDEKEVRVCDWLDDGGAIFVQRKPDATRNKLWEDATQLVFDHVSSPRKYLRVPTAPYLPRDLPR